MCVLLLLCLWCVDVPVVLSLVGVVVLFVCVCDLCWCLLCCVCFVCGLSCLCCPLCFGLSWFVFVLECLALVCYSLRFVVVLLVVL